MKAQGRREIRELLARHDVHPRRSLGQNFLCDPNLVDRIVRTAAVGSGDRVVEVGAGTGTLTRALAATGATVIAYEVDGRLQPLLAEVLAGTGVTLRIEDAAGIDLSSALPPGEWTMVANLPYNVGTPLVLDVLRRVTRITRLVVMVQRELADRFLATPGSRAYGLPSLVIALHATATSAFPVPPRVFYPEPGVDSAVMEITRRQAPDGAEEALSLAAAAFGQRRKMLRRSLAAVLADPAATLAAAGIAATARPEQLAATDFLRLAAVAA
jgi:16S rRNA (adenine1518-N6/adenine1519-N6)-dimethyltransferase